MYIQSPTPEAQDGFTLPKGYSGSAFTAKGAQTVQETPTSAPPMPDASPTRSERDSPDTPEKKSEEEAPQGEQDTAAAAFAPSREKRGEGSLLTRLPFLSSLLPPARHKDGKSGLPEWAVIGLVLFLLLNDSERDGDLLPFVLLLLLWD